ncbi:TerD family protein [Desulfonema magnum]|uniref:TerD domain-containing protein n=1 Tax=Desulfonema magnum TaxID=45655 RepID=A0A975GKM6_9BACT|nr:stress response protein [Desulfonema magnum]QTA84899.1 TerD domain-containing protein [Desulfonema magnum]
MELKQKGTKADIGAFKQMKVSLTWRSAVDLDLMAFYKTGDGRTGGVYSDNYAGGTLGDLNQFPFIELSGDEGVGAVGGENSEDMRIVKLDDFEELYICALNFTDASSGTDKVFADYDARVDVVTDRGESHTVVLDSQQPGPVAVICKFAGGLISNSLINDSEVMRLEEFRSRIPGASELKLASKITLKSKGDSYALRPKVSAGEILINLNWNQQPEGDQQSGGFFSKLFRGRSSAIDLDLGCLFEMRDGVKGSVQPLGNAFGAFDQPPYINHLGDDRTGAWAEGENMKINLARIQELKRVLIYTYIYEGAPNWGSTDGVVTVKVPGQPVVEVPMGSQRDSRGFCAITLLEFEGTEIKVTKLVTFHKGHSECDRTYRWGLEWVAGSKD